MINRSLIIGCLLLSAASFGQQPPHFIEQLTTAEGLTSNTINDIAQDDKGFLWIATPDGLNRYDGTEITQYFHHDNSNSIPHNFIHCLKKLPGNGLAIGTQAGLSFYDGNTGIFQNFYYRLNNGLDRYNNTIVGLEPDANGNLWAISKNCIFIFDSRHQLKKCILSPFTEAQATRERISFVERIWPLADGDMLLYLYNGWRLYSRQKDTLEEIDHSLRLRQMSFLQDLLTSSFTRNTPDAFPAAHLFKVFENYFLRIDPHRDSLTLFDENGRRYGSCHFPYNRYPYILWSQVITPFDSTRLLFLFHNYGMATLSIHWTGPEPRLDSMSSIFFNDHEFKTALRDQQDNWWLATTREGLQKIVPSRQYFRGDTLIDTRTRQPGRYEVTSFCPHSTGCWIATYGEGFFDVDRTTGHQRQYWLTHTGDDTWANFVWNIRQVSRDTLWLGTQVGLFWYCLSTHTNGHLPVTPGRPRILDSVAITTQFRDSRGLIWMGLGKGNGVCCYDSARHAFTWYRGNNAQGYPLRYPQYMAEAPDGSLWFDNDATSSLVRWDRSSGHFKVIPLPSSQNHIGNINGFCIESDSVFWLGSITCGLIKFNPVTHTHVLYGHENGLANSYINSVFQDSAKRVWLATEGGLHCFDPHTATFINYSPRNGLPVVYPTARFFYDTASGCLYNGGYGSYFCFHPDAIRSATSPPPTLITAILVNGKPWLPITGKPAEFHAGENDISIQYTAIDLAGGPSIRYAYWLMGVDTVWMPVGRQRQINFSHLMPGRYTFQVRAIGPDGRWSAAIASLPFRIYPPFTQTGWFYALLFVAAASLIYGLYRYRQRQLRRTRQIRSEISRDLHDEVGANLTNISLTSLLAKKELHDETAVSQLLERIYQDSQHVSESMREIIWSINPDIDTLGEALPRMLQYAARLLEANGIELEAAIAPEVESLKLTMRQRRDVYLIFKEGVNNMAKHSGATRALIRFSLSGRTLVMTISDNGSGFDILHVASLHNGLNNMRERAREHRWQLDIRSMPREGTTITLNTSIA